MNLAQLIGQLRLEAGFYGPPEGAPSKARRLALPEEQRVHHVADPTPLAVQQPRVSVPRHSTCIEHIEAKLAAGRRLVVCDRIRAVLMRAEGPLLMREISERAELPVRTIFNNLKNVDHVRSGTRGSYRYACPGKDGQ
jgi:hypothetical protein